MLDLSGVQRDSNYEETKLVVRYKQGKEAVTAFARQRRVPPFVSGCGLFLIGLLLSVSPALLGAPKLYGQLGLSIGLLPGVLIMGLALHPGDDWIIEKVMLFTIIACLLLLFACAVGMFSISNAYLSDDCIDYRGVSVPCWHSVVNVAMYVILEVLLIDGVWRLSARLYTKRNASGRLELLRTVVARNLIGKSATSVIFQGSFLFFSEGRTFLGSAVGILETVTLIETAVLGKIAFTYAWYKGLQSRFNSFGKITDAMALATLMSHGGGNLDEVMTSAKEKLRYVTLNSMDISDFNSIPDGNRSHSNYEKSVHCKPRDIDIFVSHSWHDPLAPKWEALTAYCDKFMREVRVRIRSHHWLTNYIDFFSARPNHSTIGSLGCGSICTAWIPILPLSRRPIR